MLHDVAHPKATIVATPSGQTPPEWVRHITGPDLSDLFGETTVRRGAAYQRKGSVVTMNVQPDGRTIVATVLGTRPYTTLVASDDELVSPSGPTEYLEVFSRCSCPLGGDCKHVVAVILEAQSRLPTTPAAPTAPPWEGVLAPVVRGAGASGQSQAHAPLALLIEVSRTPGPYQAHPHLQLRPLMRGSSGAWIRSGISWSDVQYSYQWRHFDPAQQEALAAITVAEKARTQYYYSTGQSISTDRLGPNLWRLLQDALTAGVVLVTGSKADKPVMVWPEPAEMVLDTSREGSDRDIVVRPLLRVPGAQGAPVPLGNPAHGVYISTRDGLTLARLTKPLTASMAELVDSVDCLTIPAHDATRFLTQYYPALRQLACVESSDDSVTFPEVQPPCLALRVTFDDGHRTHLQWSFHYTVGTETIAVPLLRTTAQDPVARDAAAEEALLSSLDILGTVAGLTTPLPGKTRPGVVIEPTLQDWSTIAFIRDILPVLQAREDVDVTVVGSPLDYIEVDGPPVVSVVHPRHRHARRA